VYEGVVEGRQGKPLKGIVSRTNLNMLTQLCMMLDAILADYKVESGDPVVIIRTLCAIFLLFSSSLFFLAIIPVHQIDNFHSMQPKRLPSKHLFVGKFNNS